MCILCISIVLHFFNCFFILLHFYIVTFIHLIFYSSLLYTDKKNISH